MSDERRQYVRYFNKGELQLLRQLINAEIDELTKEDKQRGSINQEMVKDAYQEMIRDYKSMLRKLQEDYEAPNV
jgi:hypothetical protein